MDSRAISHILSHSADYPKPDQMRDNLIRLFGKGELDNLSDPIITNNLVIRRIARRR